MLRLLLLSVLLPSAAWAIQPCNTHDQMLLGLAEEFGEARVSVALGRVPSGAMAVMETWVNRETGTWTLTATEPGGPTCISTYGAAWEPAKDGPLAGEAM